MEEGGKGKPVKQVSVRSNVMLISLVLTVAEKTHRRANQR